MFQYWLILIFICSILWLCNNMDPKSLHFLCFKCTFCHLWHQDAARGMEDEARWRSRGNGRSAIRSAPQRWWGKFASSFFQCYGLIIWWKWKQCIQPLKQQIQISEHLFIANGCYVREEAVDTCMGARYSWWSTHTGGERMVQGNCGPSCIPH